MRIMFQLTSPLSIGKFPSAMQRPGHLLVLSATSVDATVASCDGCCSSAPAAWKRRPTSQRLEFPFGAVGQSVIVAETVDLSATLTVVNADVVGQFSNRINLAVD